MEPPKDNKQEFMASEDQSDHRRFFLNSALQIPSQDQNDHRIGSNGHTQERKGSKERKRSKEATDSRNNSKEKVQERKGSKERQTSKEAADSRNNSKEKAGQEPSKPNDEKEMERLRAWNAALMGKWPSNQSTHSLKPVIAPAIPCDEYSVRLPRPMAGQFGLLYRAISAPGRPHLFVIQVLPGGAADIWNQWADPNTNRIRPGDLIIEVNGNVELELMLECLKNDKVVNIKLMKGACYAQRCPDGTWGIYEYDSKIFTRDGSLGQSM